MNGLVILVGLAIGVTSQNAVAKSQLTDPLRIARDCKSDLKQFCTGVRPGGLRIKNCLREKVAALSPTCLAALKATQ
jgi:hypothetical protein